MEKIIEWKNEIQNKVKNKLLANLKPSFWPIIFKKFLISSSLSLVLGFCFIIPLILSNPKSLIDFCLITLCFISNFLMFLVMSKECNLKYFLNVQFNKDYINKDLDFIFRENNTLDILSKHHISECLKDKNLIFNIEIEKEELNQFVSLLSSEQKTKFKEYLSKLELKDILNYNNIISFVSQLILEESEVQQIKLQKEKMMEINKIIDLRNNENFLELEVNGNNKLNVNELL